MLCQDVWTCRSLSPLRPLGLSNNPAFQAEGHALPRSLDRVSLPELQSALGLRIPPAPAMLSLPAAPAAQPPASHASTAMSIQVMQMRTSLLGFRKAASNLSWQHCCLNCGWQGTMSLLICRSVPTCQSLKHPQIPKHVLTC